MHGTAAKWAGQMQARPMFSPAPFFIKVIGARPALAYLGEFVPKEQLIIRQISIKGVQFHVVNNWRNSFRVPFFFFLLIFLLRLITRGSRIHMKERASKTYPLQ